MTTESTSAEKGSHLIRRILTPAIRLWLNTQVETAGDLAIAIESSDRQILQGYIPLAQVTARDTVYQGLHLGGIDVTARAIRTNGLSVLRGRGFKLLEPLPIEVNLELTEANLNASLQSPLLTKAVEDLMQRLMHHCAEITLEQKKQPSDAADEQATILPENSEKEKTTNQESDLGAPYILLRSNRLVIGGNVMDDTHGHSPLRLETGLKLKDSRTLAFYDPQLVMAGSAVVGLSLEALKHFTIDLGETTEMTMISLENQHLTCQGSIMVMP